MVLRSVEAIRWFCMEAGKSRPGDQVARRLLRTEVQSVYWVWRRASGEMLRTEILG